MTEKSLFKTNITVLNRVYSYLRRSQKMNGKCTYVILCSENQNKLEQATKLIDEAIAILNEIK